MSRVNIINEDDDNHSLSLSTNSDDDSDESYCHTHRSCSRYASCNRKKHEHSSIDSTISTCLSNNSKPIKGEIRSIANEPGHRQKYDGQKWRRICSNPNCLIYLNGGIFYENWLCRKHYLQTIAINTSSESDTSIIEDTRKKKLVDKRSERPLTRKFNKKIDPYKRGDIRINTDGIRQKYDGRSWRPVCIYNNCISFVVRHDYCHRHWINIQKDKSSLKNIQKQNSKITKSISSTIEKPKKGDIQSIRQQWNGTKWYSLCNYYTRDCTRRSAGIKRAYLCDIHYKEYKEKQKDSNLINKNDQILLSPTLKRKNISSDTIDKQNTTPSYQSESNIEQIKRTEQCIQTVITYPIDSIDLRQGCILIEDDNNEQNQSESSPLMVCIKKEEEDYLINRRKISMDINSLSINCKLELTKLEI